MTDVAFLTSQVFNPLMVRGAVRHTQILITFRLLQSYKYWQ